ncbi:MAG: primosomal protein N' [Dehalococcoidales bacterium]|nr:primosomal protein N' [Dehalococcoidales bacterium]
MGYAEVSVNSPLSQRRTFSYAIPASLTVEVGQAVWVPFGNKLLQGVVLELTDYPAVEETRDIAGIIEPRLVLSSYHLLLARWISEYYLSPLFDAVALILPPGFERHAITYISALPAPPEFNLASLTREQRYVLQLVTRRGKLNLRELEKSLGTRQTRLITGQLISQGLVVKGSELEPLRVKPRRMAHLRLIISPDEVRQEAAILQSRGRATKQAALLGFLSQNTQPVPLIEVRRQVNCSSSVIKAVVDRGFAEVSQLEVIREPISYQRIIPQKPLHLTGYQRSALTAISHALLSDSGAEASSRVFLLHGVTGSGKTEVYLQALAAAVKQGKRGIVLVPEIALTPQTIERFAARFPHRVAVLHSKLSLGERFDEWQRIKNGEFDVVIGSRSAIFAPQPELGLIIIDEEHEWTYKQMDKLPRYHCRDVALKLAKLTGAVVVLGSATPDVETFYHAQRGDYRLLQLPQRVVPNEGSPLPDVEVVDLREELRSGNRSIFSRSLSQAITEAVANNQQVILFLNRRGGATFVQCRNCGLVLRCRRCDVPLTYHFVEDTLICHQCNYRMPVPRVCPRCRSRRIKFLGIGTQKLEQEVGHYFPQARLLRWDSDTTRKRGAHQRILTSFRTHQADILIGTQMVAKGLDIPSITLVGVVNADISLNLPDFRAGERTFQLLSQVVGRAGRGILGGRVIIQTYSPTHYAILAAAKHDYSRFYEQEIDYRRRLRNPPFSQLARLVYVHTNNARCQHEAARMKDLLSQTIAARGIDNIGLIGPAPAFIQRRRGRFRWQIILRGTGLSDFLSRVPFPQGWTIDIDPIGLV